MARERRTNLYPAQIRYQQRNPMVSFRIPKDEYDQLKEKAKNSRISLAGLVRKRLREASQRKDAHKEGYEDDFQATKRKLEASIKKARERGYEEGSQAANKNAKKLIEKVLKEGYDEGVKQTKSRFEITYPCAVCGEMMTMYPNQDDHKAMQELMVQYGWKHNNCGE